MPTVVTLDIYSGRPNPTWVLSDEQSTELADRFHAIQEPTTQASSGALGKLGYRGFVVTPTGGGQLHPAFHVHEGVVDKGLQETNVISRDRELESFLLSTARQALPTEVRSHVETELKVPPADLAEFFRWPPIVPPCPKCVAADAPVYNPALWNTPAVQPHNNCYNYANDHITNTFAQPGRAHGYNITSLACNGAGAVEPGALKDGLVPSANFTTPLAAGHGWYVALVIWPGSDYHWYRQDKVGCWSHKPGSTPARNVDNAGHAISDPRTCNRGPYTVFCTYMITTRRVVIR